MSATLSVALLPLPPEKAREGGALGCRWWQGPCSMLTMAAPVFWQQLGKGQGSLFTTQLIIRFPLCCPVQMSLKAPQSRLALPQLLAAIFPLATVLRSQELPALMGLGNIPVFLWFLTRTLNQSRAHCPTQLSENTEPNIWSIPMGQASS